MADPQDLRRAADELSRMADAAKVAEHAQAALSSVHARHQEVFAPHIGNYSPEDRHRVEQEANAITATETFRLFGRSWWMIEQLAECELTVGAPLDQFRFAWPRLGTESEKTLRRLDPQPRSDLVRAIEDLVIDGFGVGAAISRAMAPEADARDLLDDDAFAEPNAEVTHRTVEVWAMTWSYVLRQVDGSGWLLMRTVAAPSADRFRGTAQAAGLFKRRRQRDVEPTVFGYLGAGFSLYRTYVRTTRVYLQDAIGSDRFSFQGAGYDAERGAVTSPTG